MLHEYLKKMMNFARSQHHIPEYVHVGYFATAAGWFHEYHAVLAGACGIMLVVTLVFSGSSE